LLANHSRVCGAPVPGEVPAVDQEVKTQEQEETFYVVVDNTLLPYDPTFFSTPSMINSTVIVFQISVVFSHTFCSYLIKGYLKIIVIHRNMIK
jgi:hypothetical protein